MPDNTQVTIPANPGDVIRTIDRANTAINPGTTDKTQVVQLDAGGEATESLVTLANPLPTKDTNVAAAASADAPIATRIVGNPDGDFAGVDLIEATMDTGSGLGVNVKVQNQPLQDANGGLILSDGLLQTIQIQGGTRSYIDVAGYGTFTFYCSQLSQIVFSNDKVNATIYPGNDIFPGSQGTVNIPVGTWSVPVRARYVGILNTSGLVATVTYCLKSGVMPNQSVNIGSLAGNIYASTNLSGTLPVAGTWFDNGGVTAFSLGVSGIDRTNNNKSHYFTTDNTGNLCVGGVLYPGWQWGQFNVTFGKYTQTISFQTQANSSPNPALIGGLDQSGTARFAKTDSDGTLLVKNAPTEGVGQSVPELLRQILGALRVMTYQNVEILRALNPNVTPDDPDLMQDDMLDSPAFINMTNN